MKNDPESIKQIEVGSIVQVDPQFEHLDQAGRIGFVQEKFSWGASVEFGDGIRSMNITWGGFEPTGGRMVWSPMGRAGARLTEAPKLVRHHP